MLGRSELHYWVNIHYSVSWPKSRERMNQVKMSIPSNNYDRILLSGSGYHLGQTLCGSVDESCRACTSDDNDVVDHVVVVGRWKKTDGRFATPDQRLLLDRPTESLDPVADNEEDRYLWMNNSSCFVDRGKPLQTGCVESSA